MSKIGDILIEVKQKLSSIPNIKSLKIGMERGIGSKDSTFIRIVPELNEKEKEGRQSRCNPDGSGGMDSLTIQIIYGFDLKNQELEDLYSAFYDLEEQIRSAILTKYTSAGHATFIHTATDEDKLQNIKSAISRFKVSGIR